MREEMRRQKVWHGAAASFFPARVLQGQDGSGTTYLKTADTADNGNLTMLRQDMLLSGEINLSLHTFLPELSFGGNDVFYIRLK